MISPSVLQQLQREQHHHDEKFHADILRLPVQHRMIHMTLHNSKYVGAAIQAKLDEDFDKLQRILVDTFIIALASANTLNIPLWELYKPSDGKPESAPGRDTDPDGYVLFIQEIGPAAGRMAKAVESLDHLEAFPFRETLETEVSHICSIVLHISDILKIDLATAVRHRWGSVEKKSILFDPDHQTDNDLPGSQFRIA